MNNCARSTEEAKKVIAMLRKQADKHAKVAKQWGTQSLTGSWHGGARDSLRAAASRIYRGGHLGS